MILNAVPSHHDPRPDQINAILHNMSGNGVYNDETHCEDGDGLPFELGSRQTLDGLDGREIVDLGCLLDLCLVSRSLQH